MYEITSGKQKENESGYDFFRRMLALKNQLKTTMDEGTFLQSVKIGLNTDVKNKIVLHDCSTIVKLENIL